MNELFTILIHQPVFNILVGFYKLFGENLGLAIIAVALLSRLILLPLAVKQNSMMSKNKEFQDKVKEIKNRHKNDKTKQQEEIMKIQSEYLPAQLSGCLPLIVQFILLITINNVFSEIFLNPDKFTEVFSKYAYGPLSNLFQSGYVLNTNFLGIDLNIHPGALGFGTAAIIPYIILIVLVGLTQYYSMKVIQPKTDLKKEEEDKKAKEKAKSQEKPTQDFAEALAQSTKQTMFLFPIMIVTVAYNFAAGLSLYWIAQSTFVIIQQLLLNKRKKDKVIV